MAQKGMTRDGEAYCLQCKSYVDPTIGRCPSCGSEFVEDVKAFFCPRCASLLTLGTAECSQCGMKFRVKAIRHDGSVVDLDRYPPEKVEHTATEEVGSIRSESDEDRRLSQEQLDQLRGLVEGITDLVETRSAVMARMTQRDGEDRERLASLGELDASNPKLDLVEAEVMALSDDMASLMKLYAGMLSVAEDITAVSESLGLSAEARERGLAAKALRMKTESGDAGEDGLKVKEEQLAKREDMVDRKIKGYAQKKRELDDREAELSAGLERLQRERGILDEMKASASPSAGESIRENERAELDREVLRRLVRIETALRGGQEPSQHDEDSTVDSQLSSLESLTRRILEEKEETGLRMRELEESEDEVRRLLKSLDQLLGQLPESVVLQFTQSEDYKLYEQVLDRLKI